MLIIDSNVWVALFNKNDSQHNKAKSFFDKLEMKVIIPEYVFIEVSTILLIKAGKNIAKKFIEIAQDNSDVEICLSSGELFLNTLRIFKNSAKDKLSFVDISLLFLSESYKIITFDKNLQKAINIHKN